MTREDVRDRFLASIAERLPAEKIVEVHLFPPIKQGGQESGVAVIAAAENRTVSFADRSAENDRRLTVFTARYRLTLKGPERGKWEFVIQVEADAPLVTIDKVVRGVQTRSGDAEDPARLTGDDFRALVPQKVADAPPAGEQQT